MPSSSYMLREKEYEASKARTTPFDVHCKSLLEYFGLRQAVYDGYFSDQNGILICFDAKLASFGDGWIMCNDYLGKYVSGTGLEVFGRCYGEKAFFIDSGRE